MVESVVATNWNIRQVDPKAYGSGGNHACLWDMAREQLVKEGYVDNNVDRIRAKIVEIVDFHNKQTDQPNFRPIHNPDRIGANQTIYMPAWSTAIPAGTKAKAGDKWASPDGNTTLQVEAGKNAQGQSTLQLRVYRDDGGGVGTAADLHMGNDVQTLEVTSDGKLLATGSAGQRFEFGAGQATNVRLEVQNDGHVVLYGEKNGDKNSVLWKSMSQRIAPA
jgi:hypothetical protein